MVATYNVWFLILMSIVSNWHVVLGISEINTMELAEGPKIIGKEGMMKIQPGLDKVTYELSHEEYKQLTFVVRELAKFMEKYKYDYSHLGWEFLNGIAEILEVKIDESEEEQTQGQGQ